VRAPLSDRLHRALGGDRGSGRTLKAALLFAAVAAIFIYAATLSRSPQLSHVNVAFLSGSPEGNYHATVARVAAEAQHRHGRIANVASAGSVENMARLAEARHGCRIQYALVQDGLPWPQSSAFQLIARLPDPESFVVLGRNADAIRSVADLRGKRVGIGPVGSGTEHVARQIMKEVPGLDIRVSTQPVPDQLAMLERGDLDLGAMVIDADAALMVDAVRRRKLQIADIAGADAIAHRLPSAHEGVIRAGYYDPVFGLPPTDKRVIHIDTLIIGNGCARESVTQGVIDALVRVFPDLVRVNRERPNLTGLQYASAAQSYFDNQGPDPIGEYLPWLIDIMPTARWLQLAFAFSLLFGAQAMWHRFRLWRLDARRVRIEGVVADLFGPHAGVDDIAEMQPESRHRTSEMRARLDGTIAELERLAQRCRRQSLSMLVPMGQEMNYRYQEGLVAALLRALRHFRDKLGS
jgi:hypothetical protein